MKSEIDLAWEKFSKDINDRLVRAHRTGRRDELRKVVDAIERYMQITAMNRYEHATTLHILSFLRMRLSDVEYDLRTTQHTER